MTDPAAKTSALSAAEVRYTRAKIAARRAAYARIPKGATYDDTETAIAERLLATLDAARTDYEARITALEGALAEIWHSIPATYDPNDPMVQRHAKALNAIPEVTGALDGLHAALLATPPTAVEPD